MYCQDHEELVMGACQTCGREVCDVCLEDVESVEDFECPDCGEYGVETYDADYDFGSYGGEEE